MSAWHIKNVLKKENSESEYSHFLKCCRAAGMNNIETIENQICQMLVLDCIVANSDRHFNNFGFIRDANTLEWYGLAPVFDTGTSLFHDLSVYDLRNGFADIEHKIKSKPFAKTHQENIVKLYRLKILQIFPTGQRLYSDETSIYPKKIIYFVLFLKQDLKKPSGLLKIKNKAGFIKSYITNLSL